MTNSSINTRVGAISFVNTVPIYSAYQPSAGFELYYNVPAQLNAQIRSGELQISPVSSACYIREKANLVLLSDLSVSSSGSVESVIFLSKTPLGPNMLDASHIHIPNDSETSVMLLAYLLKEATGEDLRPWFKLYEANNYLSTLQKEGNALVIGDNALLVQASIARGELPGLHCYDLSTLWREKTGLPFVFAVWVANRDWAEAYPEKLTQVNQELCQARSLFFSQAKQYEAGLELAQQKSSLPRATLERYYSHCLDYNLGEAHQQALSRFETIIHESAHWETSHREQPVA